VFQSGLTFIVSTFRRTRAQSGKGLRDSDNRSCTAAEDNHRRNSARLFIACRQKGWFETRLAIDHSADQSFDIVLLM